MSNREKLLAGAKECLRERGYARTTARDVVAASGANLASIGYHFGSMESLLTEAMLEGVGEWGARLEQLLTEEPPPDLERTWTRIIDSFAEHRAMLVASFDVFVQAERVPELRAKLAEAYEGARENLAPLFLREVPDDPRAARAVGSVAMAMMTGFMAQWITDPERAPNGRDVAEALRLLGLAATPPVADLS